MSNEFKVGDLVRLIFSESSDFKIYKMIVNYKSDWCEVSSQPQRFNYKCRKSQLRHATAGEIIQYWAGVVNAGHA